MEIRNFSYFNAQQTTDAKKSAHNATDQDFDLELQAMTNQGSGPVIQGSGHFWCHVTDECTGAVCVSIAVCG